jgi:hypothetical protein
LTNNTEWKKLITITHCTIPFIESSRRRKVTAVYEACWWFFWGNVVIVPGVGVYIFFFFAVLRLELRVYTLSHSTSFYFVKCFFKIGSHELFAQAGFEP